MKWKLILSLAMICITCFVKAQDTLPNFTVKDVGNNRVQVSWVNPYETIVQLNVQRSFDSLRGYKTIFSPQSPALKQNGFVDTKVPPATKMYYRIFYVLAGGSYFFTASKKPPSGVMMPGVAEMENQLLITIRFKDAIIAQYNQQEYKKFRDSIIYQTKDTLFALSATEILIRPYSSREFWRPSQYIFTSREGLINIKLPGAPAKHYRVVFFEEDGTQLFEIGKVKEASLIVDKANFIHSGWFLFDLYEDGTLKERNKFYVARDF